MSADWLDEHLETFVRPVLGCVPNLEPDMWAVAFRPDTVKELIKVWNQAKKLAGERTILLPGRDAFLFEVVAKIQGDHPTIFKPEYSGSVSKSGKVTEDYSKCFGVDSGYSGSVPKALKCADFGLVNGAKQLINPLSYLTCGTLESSPKYWNTGTIKNGKIFQDLVKNHGVFSSAAQITRQVGKLVIRNL